MERHYLGAGSCPDGSEPVVKVLAAVEGDRVEVSAGGVLVNGVRLPHSRPLDRRPRRARVAALRGGRASTGARRGLALLALRERSWDSRYFGPVRIENVTTIVEPLVTFR